MSQSSIIAALQHELVSGGGNGNPLQYSCLENSMGRLAWWATDRVDISHSVMSLQLFTSLWTIAPWAPLSMGFSRQENWSGLLFPCQGICLTPALRVDSLPSEPPVKPPEVCGPEKFRGYWVHCQLVSQQEFRAEKKTSSHQTAATRYDESWGNSGCENTG